MKRTERISNAKRYTISLLETFIVSFLWFFLLWIEKALENWDINQEILVSLLFASIISALKWVVKLSREYLNWYLLNKK